MEAIEALRATREAIEAAMTAREGA